MREKVIICPAYNTSHDGVWYQWLKSSLEKRGYKARVMEFPNISAPSEEKWVETIKNADVSDSTTLVGHSLGCRAILAYLNQHRVKVDSIVLIACPNYWDGIVDTRPPLKSYVDAMQKIDFDLIKSLVNSVHLYHGANDPILSSRDIKFFEKAFGEKARTSISESYGHYDVDEIPELLDIFPKQ